MFPPRGLTEIVELYGNPDPDGDGNLNTSWWDQYMLLYTLPWPMRTSWDGREVTRQWIHRAVGPHMIAALEDIGRQVPIKCLRECNCDRLGGVFNFRRKRGGGEMSTHAWGIAIDINPHLGPLGGPDHQPDFIKRAFTTRGFMNLAHDTMHFQLASGY